MVQYYPVQINLIKYIYLRSYHLKCAMQWITSLTYYYFYCLFFLFCFFVRSFWISNRLLGTESDDL